jgi:hypothetical protein
MRAWRGKQHVDYYDYDYYYYKTDSLTLEVEVAMANSAQGHTEVDQDTEAMRPCGVQLSLKGTHVMLGHIMNDHEVA